jgi:hypothetical protein
MAAFMKNIERPSDLASLIAIVIAFGGLGATQAFKADLAILIGQTLADRISAGIDIISSLAGVASIALRLQSNPSPPPGQEHVTVPVGSALSQNPTPPDLTKGP